MISIFLYGVFVCGMITAILIWLNVSENKRRAKLTLEERQKEDEEMQIW